MVQIDANTQIRSTIMGALMLVLEFSWFEWKYENNHENRTTIFTISMKVDMLPIIISSVQALQDSILLFTNHYHPNNPSLNDILV